MHVGVLGISQSGKTSLCKELCDEYTVAGHGTLVYDPLFDDGWNASLVTADKGEFIEAYFGSQNCRVFIDESSELDRHADKEFAAMATRGRHYGHLNFFIAQRFTMMPRNIRSQISRVFSFRQGPEDARELSKQIGEKSLLQVSQLQRGKYMYSDGFTTFNDELF